MCASVHVSCWAIQVKNWYSEVKISATSKSVSSIMDEKLNVLKYPQLGQLAELLVLSLTGLRNTGVIIPSHRQGSRIPRVSRSQSRAHIYIYGHTVETPVECIHAHASPICVGHTSFSPLCSDTFCPSLPRFFTSGRRVEKWHHILMGEWEMVSLLWQHGVKAITPIKGECPAIKRQWRWVGGRQGEQSSMKEKWVCPQNKNKRRELWCMAGQTRTCMLFEIWDLWLYVSLNKVYNRLQMAS